MIALTFQDGLFLKEFRKIRLVKGINTQTRIIFKNKHYNKSLWKYRYRINLYILEQ